MRELSLDNVGHVVEKRRLVVSGTKCLELAIGRGGCGEGGHVVYHMMLMYLLA